MKQGQMEVLGICNYEKNGKRSFVLHAKTPFSEYQAKEQNGVGFAVTTEWTNSCDLSGIQPGDVIEPIYSKGFGDKAVLTNVRVVESKAVAKKA